MPESGASTPEDLLAEAERRANALRSTGELPADIDQRLADDYTRVVRRATERAPLDPRQAIDALKSMPPISMSQVETVASKPGGAAVKRAATRLVRDQLIGLATQSEHARSAALDALETMSGEIERLRRLTDDAVASADMLASRVTNLERQLARLPRSTESQDELAT